jgi:membrane-bound lytic murein transglycosylase D
MKIKSLLLLLLIPLLIPASELTDKYPSYNYVLSEFDIDTAYAYDDRFIVYVKDHDRQMQRFYRHVVTRERWLVTMVRGALLEEGMSDLFLYLSMVESGLRSEAVSPKKAVGLWQFMPKTARAYSLQVCNSVDERCDPVSATRAAIRHLQSLHKRFGKWYLAVLAYNCGEGRLSKAIRRAGTDALTVLLDDDAKYLPRETREYLKKILLVAMIGESEVISTDASFVENGMVQVEVKGGTDLRDIASLIGLDTEELLHINPVYRSGVLPTSKSLYRITIPEEAMVAFYMKYQPEEEDSLQHAYLLSHHVMLGETLESIAKKYHTQPDEIKAANGLKEEILEAGALLVVPVSETVFYRSREEENTEHSSRDKVK